MAADPSTQKPLALTCGDPAGVGPEVVAGWLVESRPPPESVCVFGPKLWLESLGLPEESCQAVGPSDFLATPGKPTEEGARVALEALEASAQGCLDGRFDGVVTAPVSKLWLQRVGYAFPGQTEFFAARWGGEPTMAFAGKELRVVLATWHIPLREVGPALQNDPSLLDRAVERADELARAYSAGTSRIAVCGLNPHAGEGGLLGSEERDWIDPQLDELRQRFPGLSPALPADTVFFRMRRGEFDAVVALYHDQGLGPLKTLEFDTAVNVTLGLPHIRTSPDHGTAFAIAGTGQASTSSFAHAVEVARRLAKAGNV